MTQQLDWLFVIVTHSHQQLCCPSRSWGAALERTEKSRALPLVEIYPPIKFLYKEFRPSYLLILLYSNALISIAELILSVYTKKFISGSRRQYEIC